MNQIELHKTIEKVISRQPSSVKASHLSSLVNTNDDAKQYFFFKADEKWLEWLWENGFLDAIKKEAKDKNSYGFRMPELNYLVSVSEKKPGIATKIICSFEINSTNFNPEVVDQFTRNASKFPAKYLKQIAKKIRDEKWIKLMGKYTQYGFEYSDMLKTLYEAKDFESILVLSEAILLVRSKKEIKERKYSYRGDDVFYIHNLPETKVFEYLVDMPDKHIGKALSIALKAFMEAIEDEGDYILMDEDFFTLKLSGVVGHHYREQLKFLAATVFELVRKIFDSKSYDSKKIFTRYFATLPQNQIIRRLKLFVFSCDPKLFSDQLESEYFKLFKVEKISEVLYGAEYERSLKAGFPYLSESKRRSYVNKTIRLLTKVENEDDEKWKKYYGFRIFSAISEYLTPQELELIKAKGFKLDPKRQPEPSIGRMRGGTVTPRSPIELSDLPVKEVAEKLKKELTPQELQKKYKNDDFLNPRDADGVAAQLKDDIKSRLSEYLDNATLFFDREKTIPHYAQAFLWGVKDALSENRSNSDNLKYDELLKLLQDIKKSGQDKPFDKRSDESEGRWLSGWGSVHTTIADVIEELIKQKDKKTLLDFKKNRSQVFSILEYLLNFADPKPADEKSNTAKSTIKHPNESETFVSDPYTIAINSVRGQAFQTLLHFIYQDASNNKNKLAEDVKELYTNLVRNEETRAIMFMFGHYLPSFHYRDMDWVRSKFSKIFESKSKGKYLHLAVWEGYLSTNLYKELFFEPYLQKLYKKNITLKLKYPKQKFFKDPHEALAIHLALAFVNYEDFGFKHPLFKKFLKDADTKQLSEFISFLGRSYIAGDNHNAIKDKDNPWKIERIKALWDMMLEVKGRTPSLREFGTWIDVEKEVFDVVWLASKINQTLEATNGDLEWDYGLIKSIEKIAAEAPKDALGILEKHFLHAINVEKTVFPIRDDKEWYTAFKILYKNKKVKNDTYNLINKLIEKGGKQFWSLEDIVRE